MILGSVAPITPKEGLYYPKLPQKSDTKEISEAHNRINVGIYAVTNEDR